VGRSTGVSTYLFKETKLYLQSYNLTQWSNTPCHKTADNFFALSSRVFTNLLVEMVNHKYATLVIASLAYIGSVACTQCYVCGGQSILAEKCVDEYPLTMREDNKQDCADVLGHTVGCVKSKYVDLEERQIVTRGCAPEVGMHADNECKSTEVGGHKVFFCHCEGDFCNRSSGTASVSLWIIISMTVISMLLASKGDSVL